MLQSQVIQSKQANRNQEGLLHLSQEKCRAREEQDRHSAGSGPGKCMSQLSEEVEPAGPLRWSEMRSTITDLGQQAHRDEGASQSHTASQSVSDRPQGRVPPQGAWEIERKASTGWTSWASSVSGQRLLVYLCWDRNMAAAG